MALAQIDCWDIDSSDTIAQFASIGFDATISEIFTAVLSGASLAVLTEQERLGREFLDAMLRLAVTTITLPPSVLNIYGPADFPSLRKVVTAGEACTYTTAMRWSNIESGVRFFNAYGPTETTVCATIHECCSRDLNEAMPSAELPIGKAINGVQVYLFDNFLKPVPALVVGEIFIGGRGVSAGYIGHATGKNCERFIENPLDCEGGLLYRTGDHAVQDSSGCLTFIGRMDDQVKIRGQRVDLNEIEQAILSYPHVDMAVVVKHQSKASSDARLAAFIVPMDVNTSDLREFLARILPCFMMPTYIKKMDVKDFPLTLNGKIDRNKLERDQSVLNQCTNAQLCDLTDTQLSMAKLWCRVIQIDDSHAYTLHKSSTFTELGGTSLHMVLLQRAIEEEFKIRLSFAEIGQASSLEDFDDFIRSPIESLQLQDRKKVDITSQLIQDAILDLTKLPGLVSLRNGEKQGFEPENILLSGSTGFLGAFLLLEFLQQSDTHVYCMVREKTEEGGFKRVVDNMKKYKIWDDNFGSRITPVLSDLSKPGLGLDSECYKFVSNTIDIVFMNAAMMNFNADYHDHKVANVDSTYEFIRLAMTGKTKFLFSTSSLAVFLFPHRSHQNSNDGLEDHYPYSPKYSKMNEAGGKQPVFFSENFVNENSLRLRLENMSELLLGTKQRKDLTKSPSCLTDVNTNSITSTLPMKSDFTKSPISNDADDSFRQDNLMFKPKKDKNRKRVTHTEVEDIPDPSHIEGGYDQSKWVSERLVFQALNHLPGGAVFRPGRVSGNSKSGVGQAYDLFACILRGVPQLGFAPDYDFPFDLTPVDFCAKAMVEITLENWRDNKKTTPKTYHLYNKSTIKFSDMFDKTKVKTLPLDKWREKVLLADSTNPLVPFIPFIFSQFWDRSHDWPVFSTKNVDMLISPECRKLCPPSQNLLELYINYFKNSNLL